MFGGKIMKNKQLYLALVMAIVSIIGSSVFTMPVNANVPLVMEQNGWTDTFAVETLDTRWSWVRENPLYWSLTTNPGFLRLVTRGSLHQTQNNLENLLLTPVMSDDYQLITKVSVAPTENYQNAGLIVYQDDDNYLEVTRVYRDGGNVRIKQELGGVSSSSYVAGVTATTLYLRLDKYGDDYFGFYSLDGAVWEFVGQYNISLSDPSVGLMAANGPTTSEVDADFDYFQFSPRVFNNTWTDDFDETALGNEWTWLNEDPTHWSLTTNPGFIQIITQSGSLYSGNYHNFLVTNAPPDNYRLTTGVIISPTETFQGASLVVYDDDSNYLKIGRRFANSGNEVNFRHSREGTLIVNTSTPEATTVIFLRIIKVDNSYLGYYSIDGNSYKYVGQTDVVLSDAKIGIISENGPSTLEISADFDFFTIETYLNHIYLPLVIR
jgi:beta-xylosidase